MCSRVPPCVGPKNSLCLILEMKPVNCGHVVCLVLKVIIICETKKRGVQKVAEKCKITEHLKRQKRRLASTEFHPFSELCSCSAACFQTASDSQSWLPPLSSQVWAGEATPSTIEASVSALWIPLSELLVWCRGVRGARLELGVHCSQRLWNRWFRLAALTWRSSLNF